LLKSELNKLENLVSGEDTCSVSAECGRLQEVWTRELLKPVKEMVIARYIQYHQAGIIMLSDRCTAPDCREELEKLIVFLQRYFYKYFDMEHQVSVYQANKTKSEIDRLLLYMEKKSKPLYAGQAVIDRIYLSLREWLGEVEINYRESDRLRQLLAALEEHLQLHSRATTADLTHWHGQLTAIRRPETGFAGEPEQLALTLPVPQFALFIRLFQLAGCFREANLARIHRFFTTHFTSKRQDHISPKSFAKAFYGADQSTAAMVRGALQQMLQFIDQHYFPK
jgi:hypothetical protein